MERRRRAGGALVRGAAVIDGDLQRQRRRRFRSMTRAVLVAAEDAYHGSFTRINGSWKDFSFKIARGIASPLHRSRPARRHAVRVAPRLHRARGPARSPSSHLQTTAYATTPTWPESARKPCAWARSTLEQLRSFASIAAASGVHAYASIADAEAVVDADAGYAGHTAYRIVRGIDDGAFAGAK